jgi:hypothetical protein
LLLDQPLPILNPQKFGKNERRSEPLRAAVDENLFGFVERTPRWTNVASLIVAVKRCSLPE